MAMPRSLGSSQVTLLPPIQICPSLNVDQAGDGVEQGRLAAARRAEQHDELGLRDLEVELLQHFDRAVGDLEPRGSRRRSA